MYKTIGLDWIFYFVVLSKTEICLKIYDTYFYKCQ